MTVLDRRHHVHDHVIGQPIKGELGLDAGKGVVSKVRDFVIESLGHLSGQPLRRHRLKFTIRNDEVLGGSTHRSNR